jgi:Ferritin-like domain
VSPATRRDAFRRAGGVALAASAAPVLLRARGALAKAGGDEEVILGLVRLEQSAAVAYRTAADGGGLDAAASRLARTVAGQEQQHVDALAAALRQLGGVVPPPPGPDAVRAGGATLAGRRGQVALLGFLADLEAMLVSAYYDAQQRLQRAEYLQSTAAIMANEGQHLVLLRESLHRPPVPHAFETGRA